MRGQSLVRVLAIMRDLSNPGTRRTLYGMAAYYDVHPRTIRRDLQALQAAGVPVYQSPDSGDGEAGLWWIEGR